MYFFDSLIQKRFFRISKTSIFRGEVTDRSTIKITAYDMQVAMFDHNTFYNSRNPKMATLMFLIYTFVVNVVYVNLLIAIMTNTYARVRENEGLRFLINKAKLIDELEMTLPVWLTRNDWCVLIQLQVSIWSTPLECYIFKHGYQKNVVDLMNVPTQEHIRLTRYISKRYSTIDKPLE